MRKYNAIASLCAFILVLQLIGCGQGRQSSTNFDSEVVQTPEAGSTVQFDVQGDSDAPEVIPPEFEPNSATLAANSARSANSPGLEQQTDRGNDNRLRMSELSAILANRELHRHAEPAGPELPVGNPPLMRQPEYNYLAKVKFNISNASVDGGWLPVVSLYKSTTNLDQIFKLEFERPYGIHIKETSLTGSAIDVLEKNSDPHFVHLGLSLHEISDEGCRRLGRLPNVRSIEILGGLYARQLALLLEADRFESITFKYLAPESDPHKIKEALQKLQNLRRLTIKQSRPRMDSPTTLDIAPIYEALIEMPWVEHISIQAGVASRKLVDRFKTQRDQRNLKTLEICSEPLGYPMEFLYGFSKLERLSLCVSPHATWPTRIVNTSIRSLRLTPYTKELKEAEPFRDLRALKVLAMVSRYYALERLDVPLQVESPRHLECLTRLPHLKSFDICGLNLDRETLSILTRMPELESLTVDQLSFGHESEHLLPWLMISELHVEQEETLTDERAEMLSKTPRLRHVSWWGANHLNIFSDHLPHIEFQEYE